MPTPAQRRTPAGLRAQPGARNTATVGSGIRIIPQLYDPRAAPHCWPNRCKLPEKDEMTTILYCRVGEERATPVGVGHAELSQV